MDRKCPNSSGSGKIQKWQKHSDEKRKSMFKFRFPMSYENESSNSVFPCRIETENGNGSSNSVFPCRRKTENENGSSNSVFICRRKTVGTKVHAFSTAKLKFSWFQNPSLKIELISLKWWKSPRASAFRKLFMLKGTQKNSWRGILMKLRKYDALIFALFWRSSK